MSVARARKMPKVTKTVHKLLSQGYVADVVLMTFRLF